MEQVINDVDLYVNKNWGKNDEDYIDDDGITQNTLTFKRMIKYSLIFPICCDLRVELKHLKPYLLQETSRQMMKPMTSIRKWSKTVSDHMETKGCLNDFKNVPLPVSKKKLNYSI